MTNQKLSQWPHGQLVGALRYKARAAGSSLAEIAEDYSTRTCSGCGHVRSKTPRGRMYRCTNPDCGVKVVHRDANGAANICSRAKYGCYAQVPVQQVKHLRATVVRATTRANAARSAHPPPLPVGVP